MHVFVVFVAFWVLLLLFSKSHEPGDVASYFYFFNTTSTVRSKKNDTVCFLDIFISYKSYFKIFMVDVNKGHKFFFTKFHRRNFDACRIFYEKPIFALVGKGSKMTLDLEKCDYSANMGIIRPISLIFPKKPIDTFSNL